MKYSGLSLSRTRKGPRNLFEIERVGDRERKLGWNQWKGSEKIVRYREKFEIEGVRDRESPLYTHRTIRKYIVENGPCFLYFIGAEK